MIKKLKRKFIFINMLLVFMVLSAAFIAIYAMTSHRLTQECMAMMEQTAMRLERGDIFDNKPIKEFSGTRPEGKKEPPQPLIATFGVTVDAEGTILSIWGNIVEISDEEAVAAIVQACLDSSWETGTVRGEALRFLKRTTPTGTVIAFADRSVEISTLLSLIRTSLLVGFCSLGAFFIISLFLARWAVGPIARSWDQQRQFVADASHELKTPLTVIMANTELVLSHPRETVESQAKWLGYIQTESSRMSGLVNDLLFLARADHSRRQVPMSPVVFSDLVWGSLLPFEPVVFEQKKALESSVEPGLKVWGNATQLRQLVAILLDNAVKYAGEHGQIRVCLQRAGEKVALTVQNTGEPIPADQISHIFQRFYRVDSSRTRREGGYGLGLSIAQTIVELHRGKISVRSDERQGTTFTISLPSIK